jgi:uncharacterized protein DUF3617
MKLVFSGVLAAVVALSAPLVAQGQGPRRDGNWQVTMEMEMVGMPQRMPPTTITQCVTKADAADPQKMVPQGPGRGAVSPECTVSDYKVEGDTVSWSMKCEGQNPMTGAGEFVYTADTYNGTITMNMERAGQPFSMNMKYSGKRLGDCVK